jgi:hypothetical protein
MVRFTCTKCHQVYESDKRGDGICSQCLILVSSKPIGEDPSIEFTVDSERFLVEPVIYDFSRPKPTSMVKSQWQGFPIFLCMDKFNLKRRLDLAFSINVSMETIDSLVTQAVHNGIFKVLNERENRIAVFFTMSNYLDGNPIREIDDNSKLTVTLPNRVQSILAHEKT